jgi:uncharacterized protein with HEPN domain
MPREERDLSYPIDMVKAYRDIKEFVSGVTYEQFEHEKMRKLAHDYGEILAQRIRTIVQKHVPALYQ